MAILTYWVANAVNDSPCYSIKGKTRKAVMEGIAYTGNPESYYAKPKKVSVVYDNAFDLMKKCTGEGGAYWES